MPPADSSGGGRKTGDVLVSIVTHRGGKSLNGKTPHEQALAADGGHRAQLIQGLHDAARWLQAHPDIPVPAGVTIQYTAAGRGEVDRIAATAGEGIGGRDGFYEAERHFGPVVDYRALAISSAVKAAWDEAMQMFGGGRPAAGSVAA
jgi:hypothetical protein